MKILFDVRNSQNLPSFLEGLDDDERRQRLIEMFDLDAACVRVQGELQRQIVWAKIPDLGAQPFRVRGVRVCEEAVSPSTPDGYALCAEWLQVEILEGWRTPDLIYTDEIEVEEIAGVH